jgi:hypothetical protein
LSAGENEGQLQRMCNTAIDERKQIVLKHSRETLTNKPLRLINQKQEPNANVFRSPLDRTKFDDEMIQRYHRPDASRHRISFALDSNGSVSLSCHHIEKRCGSRVMG